MKNEKFPTLLQFFLTPALLIFLGLILIFNPDWASATIARVLGWGLLAVGAGCVAAAMITKTELVGKIVCAVVCFGVGGWMLANPLGLAAAVGRIVGLFLLVRGIEEVAEAAHWKLPLLFPVLTALVGAVLLLLPMTTSRLVFVLCGVVLLVMGLAMLGERLKMRRRIEPPEDKIIDAL